MLISYFIKEYDSVYKRYVILSMFNLYQNIMLSIIVMNDRKINIMSQSYHM